MKKNIIVLVLVLILLAIFFVFFSPKKISKGGGMLPQQYSNICKGFYFETHNDTLVDGERGGLCFGKIEKKENPKGPCPQGMNSSNTWCNDNTLENLREYKNTEAGFSFKYPAEYGEVAMTKDSDGGTGYAFQGSTGILGKENFWFTFFTKDFDISGDGDSNDNKYEPCKDKQFALSCEKVLSKNGSKFNLLTTNNPGQADYYLYVTLSNVNFRDLVFSSSNRLVLVDIASNLEISN